ncbi:MAG: hypothetical protein HC822_03675 [Oscillochloris sp.]|nr:hypothetical protein [Oscillochloris sp.]
MIEQLLRDPDAVRTAVAADEPIPPAGSAEALAAVARLAHVFADASIPQLEAVLADPLPALTNSELDDLPQ